ncbi:NifU family protein [Candidatus Trichorickettsia mobilis]|uniref:NifU family protein n=1 Tax=Candidatus Trichorickettsia mobilis TaxID=1346319 RepID=UPI0029318956|nr:NifU family protein [Candidatus Trichorickettsia mobilis]
MLIRTEYTPNPQAMKFLPGIIIAGSQPIHFSDPSHAKAKSSLALKLFDIENVTAIFFGDDFITITKSTTSDWSVLKPEILMTMMDHFTMDLPIFDCAAEKLYSSELEGVSDIEKQIIEIIETRVRPSVAMDGGDIIYRGFKDGVVKLELHGACSGCPSSSITLKNGIESMLQHFVPEVKSVEAVSE